MNSFLPLAVIGFLFVTAGTVHPQPYDRGPAPPLADASAATPHHVICVIDTPFVGHEERCPTGAGAPGSACRCAGALFDGGRVIVD